VQLGLLVGGHAERPLATGNRQPMAGPPYLLHRVQPSAPQLQLWWDRLRASTIVAPGAAAAELGLQVARAVIS
jgi:hypothetical protein